MFSSTAKKIKKQIDTLISTGTHIDGAVNFSGGLRVDGSIKGGLYEDSSSMLIISETGHIEGNIRVSYAIINGRVSGNIYVTEYIELQNAARITGCIYYKNLEMHTGAKVEGSLFYKEQQEFPGYLSSAEGEIQEGVHTRLAHEVSGSST